MLWQVPSDVRACINRSRRGELKWNVSFYSVPDCICLSEWHWASRNPLEAPLWLDINFTQMCPQRASVHEWMNAHSHTYTAAKNLGLSPCSRFHYRYDFIATTAPLAADSGLKCRLPCYLHADYNTCAQAVSLHCVHITQPLTRTHTCKWRARTRRLCPGDLMEIVRR